jgi:hypothetical protein
LCKSVSFIMRHSSLVLLRIHNKTVGTLISPLNEMSMEIPNRWVKYNQKILTQAICNMISTTYFIKYSLYLHSLLIVTFLSLPVPVAGFKPSIKHYEWSVLPLCTRGTTRGLYYKTFYGSNCCCIVISESVCHFLSLPPWPNICRQD